MKTYAFFILFVSLLVVNDGNGVLMAQTLEERVWEASTKRSWPEAVPSNQAKSVMFQGWILEEEELAPLERAAVRLMRGRVVVDGTLSDLDGYFSFKIPRRMRQDTRLRLVIAFLGRTISETPLPQDHAEVALVVSAGVELDPIEIRSEREIMEIAEYSTDRPYCGKPATKTRSFELAPVRCVMGFRPEREVLYRPLDEWLMMHNSEVYHNGRW